MSTDNTVDILEQLSASHVGATPVEPQEPIPPQPAAPVREIQRVDPDKLPGSKLDLSFQVCIYLATGFV